MPQYAQTQQAVPCVNRIQSVVGDNPQNGILMLFVVVAVLIKMKTAEVQGMVDLNGSRFYNGSVADDINPADIIFDWSVIRESQIVIGHIMSLEQFEYKLPVRTAVRSRHG